VKLVMNVMPFETLDNGVSGTKCILNFAYRAFSVKIAKVSAKTPDRNDEGCSLCLSSIFRRSGARESHQRR